MSGTTITAQHTLKSRTMFCGDNLDIMRGINSGIVDLIYLDPPFNTKKVFKATQGSVAEGAQFEDIFREEDVKDEWVDEIKRSNPRLHAYLQGIFEIGHASNWSYLVYMAIRIMEMRRILKETGSIYLHCDHTMSHYLKLLMDAIFGESNFRNEIVWHHPKIGIASKKFTSNTDTLLYYTKSTDYFFVGQKDDEPNELYNRWKGKLHGSKLYYREAKNINDSPAKSKIRVLSKQLGRALRDDDVVVDFNLPENKKAVDNVWKIAFLKGNAKESTGYPTQKPLALLKRIIASSTREDDLVLDPFCGCATTCVAAEDLGRDWIGIDVSEMAYKLVTARIRDIKPTLFTSGKPHFSTQPPVRTDMPGVDGLQVFGRHASQKSGNCRRCGQKVREAEKEMVAEQGVLYGAPEASSLLCVQCNNGAKAKLLNAEIPKETN